MTKTYSDESSIDYIKEYKKENIKQEKEWNKIKGKLLNQTGGKHKKIMEEQIILYYIHIKCSDSLTILTDKGHTYTTYLIHEMQVKIKATL